MTFDPAEHRGAMTERYGRFPDVYRARYLESGLWSNITLHEVFAEIAKEFADAKALIDEHGSETFTEFAANAEALAAGLLGVGVKPGDLVSVQLPNWREFAYLQVALSRIGAVIHPMHTVYRELEIEQLLRFCGSNAVVLPEEFKGFRYADAVTQMRGRLPDLHTVVVARGEAADAVPFSALIEEGSDHLHRLADIVVDPDDVFYINFTSGTEGDAKGFMHTHNTLVSFMNMIVLMMGLKGSGAVNLTCSPMTHSFGHFVTYYTLLGGLPTVLVDRYTPDKVLRLIEEHRVTSISGTPAHLLGILTHPAFGSYDTSSVRSVMSGGAQSAPDLLRRLDEVWGVKTSNTYGLGENIIHTQTTAADPEDKQRTTVGRPLPGRELKIVDPEQRSVEIPEGAVGEIAFRGPTLCVGYYRQPELTAASRDEDGWFFTGDLGAVDAEGYLSFRGRNKELINRGGTKIFPKEIEDLLAEMQEVQLVAVVGMPDERMGEKVCAYVVPAPGAEVTMERIAAHLTERKAMKSKFPERLIIVDEMPMTPTGKILKRELVADVTARLARENGAG